MGFWFGTSVHWDTGNYGTPGTMGQRERFWYFGEFRIDPSRNK